MAFTIIGLGLTAGSMAMSLQSSRQQQAALKVQGAYQAAILKNNAAFAEVERQQAVERGQFAVQQISLQTAQTIGSQRAPRLRCCSSGQVYVPPAFQSMRGGVATAPL